MTERFPRMPAIVILLAIAFGVSSILMVRALRTELHYRAAVRQTIADDASIVADDLLHRTIFEFEELTSYPLRQSVLRYLTAHDSVPSLDTLQHDASTSTVASLADGVFLLDLHDHFIRMARGQREVFRTAGRFDPEWGTTIVAPPAYSESVAGMNVETSFSHAAVAALVPGGVPRSNLPLLLALLITNALVLAAAFLVLRREHLLTSLRSQFVSSVSHELKTPLTQIRMFAETLLFDRVRSPEERQRSLQIINEESRRLTNLVDNVLFLSHRSAETLPPADLCDVETLVADAVDAFSPLAMRRDVVVTMDSPSPVRGRLRAEAWKQVVTNILDNAVKYGPVGQTVKVQLSSSLTLIRMTIDDEGPGIPAGERAAVWNRFYRLARDRSGQSAGSGLGLAIVHQIVEDHHGRCWVEEAPGGGARFIVEIPTDFRTSEESTT